MIYLFVALLLGILVGRKRALRSGTMRIIHYITFVSLMAIIGILGMKVTSDARIFSNLTIISVKALVLMFFSVLGSVLAVWILEKNTDLLGNQRNESSSLADEDPQATEKGMGSYLFIVRVLLTLVIGGAIGWLYPISGHMLEWGNLLLLYLLCFGVGVEVGNDHGFMYSIRTLEGKVLLLPMAVMAGSTAGACLAGLLVSIKISQAAAIGAACGFYSVAGGILAEGAGAELGAIAFMANFFREIAAFILIPILAKRVPPLAASSPGGATAMDTTFPLIFKFLGTRTALLAMVSGIVLTLLIPIVLPLLLLL